MTKTELEIISILLGKRTGPVRTMPSPYRGVYDTRQHRACEALEAEGLGRIIKIDRIAFVFKTHAMMEAEA